MAAAGSVEGAVPGELRTRLLQRKLVPFLGAGCSVPEPSRMPPAGQLAEQLIVMGAGSDGDALEDIAEAAWVRGGWREFAQLLPSDEWRARQPNGIARVIAELCKETLIQQIVTTNWDLLIETALTQIGQPYSKVVDAESMAIEPVGRVTLIKLNGCIDHPKFIKATRTHIESNDWLDAWANVLFEVLVRTNSMLFAGYSGASRAATTTIGGLVAAGERHARDFIVDRLTPKAIAEASQSGAQFVETINLAAAVTGDAEQFFHELRVAMHPSLVASPIARAREMARELLAPTQVDNDALEGPLEEIAQILKHRPPSELQDWLQATFGSYPDCEHAVPYVPLLPNKDAIANCALVLAGALWAGRLEVPRDGLGFSFNVVLREVKAQMSCRLVVTSPPRQRDAAARLAIIALDRGPREPGGHLAIGVAFGGMGAVTPVMTNFSVARGAQPRNVARGDGVSIAWIDGDALLAQFSHEADEQSVRDGLGELLDAAAARAFAEHGPPSAR